MPRTRSGWVPAMPSRPAARVRRLTALMFAGLVGVVLALPGRGAVYHSRESALELAFGPDAEVRPHELFLTQEELAAAAEAAGSPVASRLVRRYAAFREGELLGHAYLETHRVRTLPQTLLVVVRPDGSLDAVHVVAFHEPAEYRPHPGFLQQFGGRALGPDLALRGGIDGITGATFTARAVTAAARRVLAVHAALEDD